MGKALDSPFKDYVAPAPGFNVRDTLGDKPGQPTDGSGTPVSVGKVTPHELPSSKGDIWHGPKS